jgi:[acyl-carrier-protein] S-malonyltransferase
MGKDLWEASAGARKTFECASDVTGIDIKKLLFEGTEEDLKPTNNTQIAVATVDVSSAALLEERGIECSGCAGFSLGEWPALYRSSVLDLETMFRLVKIRGNLMDENAKRLGPSGMTAVLGLAPEKTEKTLAEAGIADVFVANYNSPIQAVVSGTEAGLAEAEKVLAAAGARRLVRLKVSGPFHSPLMGEAGKAFERELGGTVFSDPSIALYSNVTGKPVASGTEAKRLCVEQISSPVRWIQEEASILAGGYGRILETGPGNVLSGLWKAIGYEPACETAGNLEQAEAALKKA